MPSPPRRLVLVSWMLATACVAALVATAPPPLDGKPAGMDKPTEPDWQAWFLHVQHVARGDLAPADQTLIRQTESELAQAKGEAKLMLQRKLKRLREEAERSREFVVYGWTVPADAAGKPVDDARSMTGFFLPFDDQTSRAIDAKKLPDLFIMIPRKGSKDLFTCSGRHYFRGASATRIAKPPADWRTPAAYEAPDARSRRDAANRIRSKLTFVKTQPQSGGLVLHRWMLWLEPVDPPASARKVEAWFHVRATMPAGEDGGAAGSFGPIIEKVELDRAASGSFTISRSFEIITASGAAIDPKTVVVEPIAVRTDADGRR